MMILLFVLVTASAFETSTFGTGDVISFDRSIAVSSAAVPLKEQYQHERLQSFQVVACR